MAKKVKKEDKEAEVFKFPDFDEKEYLRGEIRDAKAIIAATILAIPIAAVAAVLTGALEEYPTLGILFGLVGFVLIWVLFKFLFKDLSEFKAKHWLMSIGGYFFTFLALWVLFINPPFMDLSAPEIDKVSYAVGAGEWTEVKMENPVVDLNVGDTYSVRAQISDNVGIQGTPTMSLNGISQEMVLVTGETDYWMAQVSDLGTIVITATDVNGHTVTYQFATF